MEYKILDCVEFFSCFLKLGIDYDHLTDQLLKGMVERGWDEDTNRIFVEIKGNPEK